MMAGELAAVRALYALASGLLGDVKICHHSGIIREVDRVGHEAFFEFYMM